MAINERGAAIAKGLTLAAGLLLASTASAHHGWAWATEDAFEITGDITAVALGNPHGELTLDVAGEAWVIEVGQPWRNQRAGLTEGLLGEGTSVTVQGHRSADPEERRVKAVAVVIDGEEYVLYQGR